MYCPNCGNESSTEQRFCRSCGLGLEKIAQSVIEQLPDKPNQSAAARKARLEWWGMAALSAFGLGVLGLILFGVVYKMMITQGKFWAGLGVFGLLALIACGLISVVLFAKANEVEQEGNKRQLQPTKTLSQGEKTTGLLPEAHPVPVPSVTERTTELLLAKEKGRAEGG
jgi:hypothetical protein